MKDMSQLPGRERHSVAGYGDARNGIAVLRRIGAKRTPPLVVQFSDGLGWDHVSVSAPGRCPTWDEMCWVKALFFEPEDVVVQFHPRASEYRNAHPYCLHLWRLQGAEFPTPDPVMVA